MGAEDRLARGLAVTPPTYNPDWARQMVVTFEGAARIARRQADALEAQWHDLEVAAAEAEANARWWRNRLTEDGHATPDVQPELPLT